MGACGVVTDVLSRDLKGLLGQDASMYACGPHAMMKCLAGQLEGMELSCQVSLEERMACGIGACLGCAVALKNRMGGQHYGRVCKDGPVFNIRHVNWEE
jgi:dihydroorotate dehydrogenase electron transfer subunit